MKIVIATPILFDQTSPFNHLMRDILQGLLDSGHEITRIVAVEHADDTDYQMGLHNITYVPVIRKRSEKSNIIQRYLSDTLKNMKMAKLLRKIKADVLFEDVSYSSIWSVLAAKRAGMRIVSMLQDVWPDNAVQSGLIKEKSLIYTYFEVLQRKVYKKSDKLICISDDMKAFIASKNVPEEKIAVIYNWGYSDEIVSIPWNENRFVEKYHLSEDCFYAIYAGNIGRMQNVELILKAAEQLREHDKIKFLIIGDGARREIIHQLAEDRKLSNVTFLPLLPSELATSIYSAAGVNLIPLVPGGVKTALPSKTGICLSCGQPIIFAFGQNCRFAEIANRYQAGIVVDAANSEEMTQAILDIAEEQNREKNYSLFLQCFRRTENVKRYEEEITT